jgi:hypothetical protein
MNDAPDQSRPDLTGVRWLRAAASDAGGQCVEVAHLADGGVAVRDPADLATPPHVFTAFEWDCFLDGARKGEFDRPTHR